MNKLALGTVQFGIDYGINSKGGQVQEEEVNNILNYAHSQSIDLLDTSPSYGSSEQVLGKINVENFKVVTKTRHFNTSEVNNSTVKIMHNDFYRSLKSLKTTDVYGMLVHNADDLLKPGSKILFDKLNNLKQDGKIKKIGVSIYDNNQLQSILKNFEIDLVQLPFNILDTRLIDSGMLATLESRGIEVHARSVFLQGLLLMSERRMLEKFKHWSSLWSTWHEWLNDNRITALEATIRYVVARSEISKVLVGVDNVHQLKQIVSAVNGKLPDIPSELFTNDVNLLNPSNWRL